MLVPPKLAGTLTTRAAGAALFLTGCSSSSPRDMNYGTDVGLGYEPPDAGNTAIDGGIGGGIDGGTNSTAKDAASDLDGGGAVDASVDASIDSSGSVDAADDMDGEAAVDSTIDADN